MTSLIAFLFVFTIVVLVHEFGHFIAARRLGIKAYEFSIGFPLSPKIITFFRHKETEFTLRLLPLGGFVRFSKEEDDEKDDVIPEFLKEERWKRAIIASAGSAFNIAFALIFLTLAFMIGKHLPLTDSILASFGSFKNVIVGTFGMFSGKGLESLSGPIGIAMIAGKAAQAGMGELFFFTGMLSLSLGIFNLLPLPALDGGQLVILAIETLKRRTLSLRSYTVVGAVGIMVFVLLTVVVSYQDILRLMA